MIKGNKLRRAIIKSSYIAVACHIGSALSCSEILDEIFDKKKKGDIFIFAKASGVAALYCKMHSVEKAAGYLARYPLPSREIKGIIHSLGSVGHGLPFSAGLALSDRTKDIYVLLSDGDLMEGSTYEAALFIGQHKLTNLFVYVDDNKLVALGKSKDILDLDNAYEFYKKNIPNFIRRETTKGAGVSFLEDKVESHYVNLTEETYKQALKELK